MASSTTQFSFFLILLITLLSSSLHIHARDSQFFSKFTNTNTNIPKENEIKPTNKQDNLPLKNNEQDDPNFIPQGQDGGYGLYGHESGQLPPSTTTTNGGETNNMYNQEKQGMSDTRFMDKKYTTPINSYESENGGKMYNPEKQSEANNYYNGENSMYNQEKQGMSDTRFMEKSYTTPINSHESENGGKMYNPEKQSEANNYYNGENSMYNQEKQGMSDTRFMEKSYTTPISSYESENGGKMYNPEKQSEANNYYNGENNMYNQEKQGMSDTRFMEKGYTTPINSYEYKNGGKMYNQEKQGMSDTRFMENSFEYNNGGKMYNSEKQGMGNNVYIPEKQGMSDTRFLENGKYHYDLNSENYNSLNANDNSRGVNSRYEYNSRGNYGNNGNSYEFNNNNANSMEFQNEEDLP